MIWFPSSLSLSSPRLAPAGAESGAAVPPHPPSALPSASTSASAPVLRPATAADLAAIIALDEATTGHAKPAYWQGIFDRFARPDSGGHVLVAMADDRMLGFIAGEVRAWEFGSPPCGWVFAVQVVPQQRLHGVGSALFEALCACFRAAGVTKIRTMLARDAQLVMSFFRSQGMMAGPFIQLEKALDE